MPSKSESEKDGGFLDVVDLKRRASFRERFSLLRRKSISIRGSFRNLSYLSENLRALIGSTRNLPTLNALNNADRRSSVVPLIRSAEDTVINRNKLEKFSHPSFQCAVLAKVNSQIFLEHCGSGVAENDCEDSDGNSNDNVNKTVVDNIETSVCDSTRTYSPLSFARNIRRSTLGPLLRHKNLGVRLSLTDCLSDCSDDFENEEQTRKDGTSRILGFVRSLTGAASQCHLYRTSPPHVALAKFLHHRVTLWNSLSTTNHCASKFDEQ